MIFNFFENVLESSENNPKILSLNKKRSNSTPERGSSTNEQDRNPQQKLPTIQKWYQFKIQEIPQFSYANISVKQRKTNR